MSATRTAEPQTLGSSTHDVHHRVMAFLSNNSPAGCERLFTSRILDRRTFWAKGLMLLLSAVTAYPAMSHSASRTASHARPAPNTIPIYTGSVNAKNAERLFDIISKSTDKVIGLKLTVEKGFPANDRYDASIYDDHLVISAGNPMDGSMELIVNGPTGTTWNMFTVDGFYLIKDGGMHAAGALSWGAMPVDEATIRLNRSVHMIARPF